MNDFIQAISLSAYLCCIDIEPLCGILMPLSYAGLSFLNLLNIGRQQCGTLRSGNSAKMQSESKIGEFMEHFQ